MRVAADQLLGDVLGHRGEVAGAALLEQQRQEVDLEEHVAELVEQLRVVVAVRGVGELVGLLDGVGDDRARVLRAVPRAVAAQAPRQLVKAREGDLAGVAHARQAPLAPVEPVELPGAVRDDVAAAARGARLPLLLDLRWSAFSAALTCCWEIWRA